VTRALFSWERAIRTRYHEHVSENPESVSQKKCTPLHRCMAARGDDDTHLQQKCNGRKMQLFGMDLHQPSPRAPPPALPSSTWQAFCLLPTWPLFFLFFLPCLEMSPFPLDTPEVVAKSASARIWVPPLQIAWGKRSLSQETPHGFGFLRCRGFSQERQDLTG